MVSGLDQNWNLDAIFPGGSGSLEFERYLKALGDDIASFDIGRSTPDAVLMLQELDARLEQCQSFVDCLTSQNVKDDRAIVLTGRVAQLGADLEILGNRLDNLLAEMDEGAWQSFIAGPLMKPISYNLEVRRRRAKDRMDIEKETLTSNLAVDGFHAWYEMYNTIAGGISIPVERNGKTEYASAGQAYNLLRDPDRGFRQELFKRYEEGWAQESQASAACLNHLAGFRLAVNKARGWDSILSEPLDRAHVGMATIDAMWAAVTKSKPRLVKYLEHKAALLGVPKLEWFDIDAPLGKNALKLSYDEGADFVIEQYGAFSSDMADFARKAITSGWVEAEDRGGKQAGAFCTSFPMIKESRVFMTYDGSIGSIGTLAHELGHAYHSYIMRDMPVFAQSYPMTLAETASTFGELIVSDAALKMARSRDEYISLLDDKFQSAVAFFMNIHARFIFELNFYKAREQGPVSSEELNDMMLNAQKEAYLDSLGGYHPYFWASKMHFYITYVPFYNFPYTFGYLFSSGIYAITKAEGKGFAERYVSLLRDTGSMAVEDLARKHFGADLTKPDFWDKAVETSLAGIDEFLKL